MLCQLVVAVLLFQTYYWGLDFLSNGGLKSQSLLIFNLLFTLWLSMEAYRVRLGHVEKSQTFGFASRMFLIISFSSVALGLFDVSTGGWLAGQLLPQSTFFLGAALFVLGIYLRHLSIKTLGKFFVTKVQITDGHKLVKDGIYAFLRHPSYTGLIAGFLGSLLMIGSGLALALFILLGIPAYYYRIHIEEKALIGAFGNEYVNYRSSTYALIPYVL
jgi:protein-S-isoprenylcysteine O-methyltransferase Ste14